MKQQFTQEEANAILMRAVEHEPLRESVSWEQLVAVASEIGVSEETLRQAHYSLQTEPRSTEAERARFLQYQREAFKSRVKCVLHLTAFLFGTFLLIGINSEVSDDIPWSLGIIVPWLMILIYHWRYARLSSGEQHEQAFQRWLRARRAYEAANPDAWADRSWPGAGGPRLVP